MKEKKIQEKPLSFYSVHQGTKYYFQRCMGQPMCVMAERGCESGQPGKCFHINLSFLAAAAAAAADVPLFFYSTAFSLFFPFSCPARGRGPGSSPGPPLSPPLVLSISAQITRAVYQSLSQQQARGGRGAEGAAGMVRRLTPPPAHEWTPVAAQ